MLYRLRKIIPASLRKANQKTLLINHLHSTTTFASLSRRPYRLAAVSVSHDDNQYGWLGLIAFKGAQAFDQQACNIINTIANQLAVMLANMRQYDALEHFTIYLVGSLVCAIKAKDVYAKGHSEGVHQCRHH